MKYKEYILRKYLLLSFCIALISCNNNFINGTQQLRDQILITDISIINVENGSINNHQDILIQQGKIKKITPHTYKKTRGFTVVDGKGKFVIPGLWDMHTHPLSERDLTLMLIHGVTGTRIMDGDTNTLRWKQQIAEGKLAGPVIYTSGETFEGTPEEKYKDLVGSLEGWEVVDTRLAATAAVQRHKQMGYDFIKIYNNLKDSVVEAIFEESKRLGMDVCGHIPFQTGLRKSIKLGIKSIEHLRGYIDEIILDHARTKLDVDFKSRTLAWNYIDTFKINEIVDVTKAAKVWNCPTFTFEIIASPRQDIQQYLRSPEGAYLIEKDIKYFTEREKLPYLSNFSEEDFNNTVTSLKNRFHFVNKLNKAGGLLLAGSDADVYGLSLHRELQNLKAAGLTNLEVLKTATINAANYFNIQKDFGTVEKGKIADLVILDENPLEKIEATTSIFAVIKTGYLLTNKEINQTKEKLKLKSSIQQYKLRR